MDGSFELEPAWPSSRDPRLVDLFYLSDTDCIYTRVRPDGNVDWVDKF